MDNIFNYFFFNYFTEKTGLDNPCTSSARQTIHMKCSALFSQKNNNKKFKLMSAVVVNGTLKVKSLEDMVYSDKQHYLGCANQKGIFGYMQTAKSKISMKIWAQLFKTNDVVS